jgi:DNA-binding NtrC family response regulator
MSSLSPSVPQRTSVTNATQPDWCLCKITLPDQIRSLRDITLALLTELESLGSLTAPAPAKNFRLDDEMRRFEIALIRAALVESRGNQVLAARLLGVKHTTLNSKIKRYQLQRAHRENGSAPASPEQKLVA